MKLSMTTTTLFASLACLVSASAPPKASVQASIATAGNRAILALDNAKQAMSTFTDTVQVAINSLEMDPAVKEDLDAYVGTLSRQIDPSIATVEGLVELYGPEGKIWHINQDTPSRKLKKITDRITAMYKEYPDFDDMPEVYQIEMNALWRDFAEQMNHVGDPPLGSNDGRVYISSKSRTKGKPAKSDGTSCPFVKLWKRLTDRTFVFRGREMLEQKEEKESVKEKVKEKHALVVELNEGVFSVSDGVAKRLRSFDVDGIDEDVELSEDSLARVQKRAEEVRKRYDEVRKRYDEAWNRAREGRKNTGEDRKSRQFEL